MLAFPHNKTMDSTGGPTVVWEFSQGNIFVIFANYTDLPNFNCENFAKYALKLGKQRAIIRFSKEWSIELSESTIQTWNTPEIDANNLETSKT